MLVGYLQCRSMWRNMLHLCVKRTKVSSIHPTAVPMYAQAYAFAKIHICGCLSRGSHTRSGSLISVYMCWLNILKHGKASDHAPRTPWSTLQENGCAK
jgi:hypothetical protein